VLVTGATGFLGGHLVEVLLHRGHEVVALARPSSDASLLAAMNGVEVRRASFTEPESLEGKLDGCAVLIHCAGGGKARGIASYYANNTESAAALRREVGRSQSGPSHFILVSSLAAGGPSTSDQARSLDDAPQPLSHYGRSKAAAEALLQEQAADCAVSILRAPMLYGPRDTRLLPLFQQVMRKLVPLPLRPRVHSMVSGHDCARALADLVLFPPPRSAIYSLDDGTRLGPRGLVEAIGSATDVSPWVVPLPSTALWFFAVLTEVLGLLRGRHALLTRDKVRDLSAEAWLCDSVRLHEVTRWQPTERFTDLADEIAQSYRSAGWIR
jgi:nucleoside-diphosphate-sugar epimerase